MYDNRILKKEKAFLQILLFLRTDSNSRKRARLLKKKRKVLHYHGDGALPAVWSAERTTTCINWEQCQYRCEFKIHNTRYYSIYVL